MRCCHWVTGEVHRSYVTWTKCDSYSAFTFAWMCNETNTRHFKMSSKHVTYWSRAKTCKFKNACSCFPLMLLCCSRFDLLQPYKFLLALEQDEWQEQVQKKRSDKRAQSVIGQRVERRWQKENVKKQEEQAGRKERCESPVTHSSVRESVDR